MGSWIGLVVLNFECYAIGWLGCDTLFWRWKFILFKMFCIDRVSSKMVNLCKKLESFLWHLCKSMCNHNQISTFKIFPIVHQTKCVFQKTADLYRVDSFECVPFDIMAQGCIIFIRFKQFRHVEKWCRKSAN